MKDRRILGDEGFVSVIAVVDISTGKIVTKPEIHARGVAEDDSVSEEIQPKIIEALEIALADGVRDTQQLEQIVRRTLGRWVGTKLRRRPMIIPIVLEV